MTPIFVAETPYQFAKLAKAENVEVISQLGQDKGKPASKWAYRHIIAYRLLTGPPKPFLLTLQDCHDKECPVCKPDSPYSQNIDQEETERLISGHHQSWHHFLNSSHSDLKGLPAGSFWIALARACSPEVLDKARVHPERERQPVSRRGFVDSTQMQVGSSSPIQSSSPKSPSSDEADLSMSIVDDDENNARRRTPEEVTVNLFNSFSEHILHACLDQQLSNNHSEIRVRIERQTSKASIAGTEITAQDDGGLCRVLFQRSAWRLDDPLVAVLEAKKAFQRIEDSPKGGTTPIVSNETLAQYLGEAVITWKANPPLRQRGTFIGPPM